MKSYEVNETLLGDGMGVPNFVYFVLSGRCQMIESLQVIVTTRIGKSYYTLHDPYVSIVFISVIIICYFTGRRSEFTELTLLNLYCKYLHKVKQMNNILMTNL